MLLCSTVCLAVCLPGCVVLHLNSHAVCTHPDCTVCHACMRESRQQAVAQPRLELCRLGALQPAWPPCSACTSSSHASMFSFSGPNQHPQYPPAQRLHQASVPVLHQLPGPLPTLAPAWQHTVQLLQPPQHTEQQVEQACLQQCGFLAWHVATACQLAMGPHMS